MIVIKAGGAVGVELKAICTDVATLVQSGKRVVLVHGGSAEANKLGEQLGHAPRFLTSVSGVRSRYTDPGTLDVLTMAMAGRIKPMLVQHLLRLGVMAIGLTGTDGALIRAQRKSAVKVVEDNDNRVRVVRDDLTGRVTQVNASLLHMLLDAGYVPVVSPPALDPGIGPVNVDADRTAAAVAVALGAERLVILSNVPGLLRDPLDPNSLIEIVSIGDIDRCLEFAKGRMKLKLIAAREALAGSVNQVVLGDGRIPSPVYQALTGRGTILGALSKKKYLDAPEQQSVLPADTLGDLYSRTTLNSPAATSTPQVVEVLVDLTYTPEEEEALSRRLRPMAYTGDCCWW